MSTVNTAAMTPAQRNTANEIIDRQMQAAGLTSAPSEQVGISTSPTATQGISQIGNYGTEAGDFDISGYSPPDDDAVGFDSGAPDYGMVDDVEISGYSPPDDDAVGFDSGASGGYSPGTGSYAENKAAADDAAKEQTGSSTASAVTDSSGNAVTSTDGSVVTNDPQKDNNGGGGGGGGCVIATHGVMTGGFTVMEKAKAELWCQKTYHGKWYGEAFRKGYKAAGLKHVNAGTAPSVYQEFKDFVAYGRGVKKGWKLGINYYWRTFSFFITGLFMK